MNILISQSYNENEKCQVRWVICFRYRFVPRVVQGHGPCFMYVCMYVYIGVCAHKNTHTHTRTCLPVGIFSSLSNALQLLKLLIYLPSPFLAVNSSPLTFSSSWLSLSGVLFLYSSYVTEHLQINLMIHFLQQQNIVRAWHLGSSLCTNSLCIKLGSDEQILPRAYRW